MCSHCHPGGPGGGNFPECTQCHTASSPPYNVDTAPEKQTHSSDVIGSYKYGTWARECLDCHEPHHNNGITGEGVSDPSYILVEFTGDYAVTVDSVTTMTISDLVVHDPDWADPATWGSKTGPERGLVLLDTINGTMYWYKVISADDTTISFVNDGTYFPQSPISNPQSLSLAYGQFIQDEINGTAVTFGGPHTMADDESGTGTDPTPNGVCQVCHTQTKFWRSDGTRANHFSGEYCASCHEHDKGFKAKGGDCAGCHLTPEPDVDDYVFGNGIMATVNQAQWETSGHGLDSSLTYAVSGSSGAGMSCNYCHDYSSSHDDAANPFRLVNTGGENGVNGVCLACHATTATGVQPPDDDSGSYPLVNSSVKVDSLHYGLRHSETSGGKFCWDCHDPHGDANIYMVHDAVSQVSDGTDGIPVTTVPVSFTSASTGTDYALSSAPFNGICQVCHTKTSHYRSNFGDNHNYHMKCTMCHRHNGGAADNAFRAPGPPIQDQYALKSRDGESINLQLDMNDTITMANGAVYAAGPAYSPRATCGTCHDYNAITRAYHFREGAGPNGENLSDTWSSENDDGTLYRYLANAYAHLESPGQYGAW